MNILLSDIKEICDNEEFTTIVLTSGNCIHTPMKENAHISMVVGEITALNGDSIPALSIDIEEPDPVYTIGDINESTEI